MSIKKNKKCVNGLSGKNPNRFKLSCCNLLFLTCASPPPCSCVVTPNTRRLSFWSLTYLIPVIVHFSLTQLVFLSHVLSSPPPQSVSPSLFPKLSPSITRATESCEQMLSVQPPCPAALCASPLLPPCLSPVLLSTYVPLPGLLSPSSASSFFSVFLLPQSVCVTRFWPQGFQGEQVIVVACGGKAYRRRVWLWKHLKRCVQLKAFCVRTTRGDSKQERRTRSRIRWNSGAIDLGSELPKIQAICLWVNNKASLFCASLTFLQTPAVFLGNSTYICIYHKFMSEPCSCTIEK